MKLLHIAILLTPAFLAVLLFIQKTDTAPEMTILNADWNENLFPHAYGSCFPGCGHPEEYFPPASIGNRTIDLALRLYSSSTVPDDTHYLWFRFYDANTNQTVHHVSFMLVFTRQGQTLFRELFHTHTGILNVRVISTPGPEWNVTAPHEPYLNGWVPYSDDQPITVHAPLFNDTGSVYHAKVTMYTIDEDNHLFDAADKPSSAPVFDFILDMKNQNQTITSPSPTVLESPLKQAKSGILSKDVICSSGLQLVFKAEDGSPACVTSKHVVPLYLRGWLDHPAYGAIVFVIKPDTNGQILVKYHNQLPAADAQLNTRLYDGGTGREFNTTALQVSAVPTTISPKENVTVAYHVVTGDIMGVYWLQIASCQFIPIAVASSPSQISNSDLQFAMSGWRCPVPFVQFHVVNASNIEIEYRQD